MVKKLVKKNIEKLPAYKPGENPRHPRVIKLASNENPLGPSPKALAAIKENLHLSCVYPDQSSHQLKEELSARLGLSVQNLCIGNGSDELMQFIAAAFLNAGEEVLISENTFSTYEFVTRLFDGTPKFIPLKNFTYDLEAIAEAITLKTKIIFLCNPNNPTGTYFNDAAFKTFLNKVPKGVIVVIDEAYANYNDASDFPRSLDLVKEGRDVVVLRTFSKLFGLAALRIGYAISKPELNHYLNMVKLPFNVNRLAQAAAAAALSDGSFIKKSLQVNDEGKKYLYSELKALGLDYIPTQANFICINLKKKADLVFIEMMRDGVIIRPLTSFGLPNAIRVTIGTKEQNKKFIAALKKAL
jgi:histidinol-phosphate aminotransferase